MVVALIVIGPERLPKVARTMGHFWGRAQRYINGVKADIERDMAVEEFRQLQKKIQEEAGELEKSVNQASQSIDNQVREFNEEVERSLPSESNMRSETKSAIESSPTPNPDKPT